MRTEKKVAIIVAVMMVILGSVMAASAFRTAEAEMKTSYKDEDYQEKKIEIAESFDDIEIKLLERDLEIVKSNDNKAYFECRESKKVKFEAYVSGGTLKIEEKLENKVLNIDSLFVSGINFDTKLYLPKDAYNNLTVSLGSGDLSIKEEFSFRDLGVTVGSGNAYLSKIEPEEVKIKTGSGNIWLYDSKVKSVQLKTGSGDISAEDLSCERTFAAEVSSGDVNVPASGNGGNCVIRTGSGDIDITVEN